ncbi:hypothetical protein BIT28_07555 [Photobacterium proteolyticum]|uniref:Uncharacterized protein n=1 Tax=Photobacterium proteolyticum TaxID=1903952 RepID=A0A1Q9G6H2_9GAMM|nr:hypothetical protein [Photobacterium proteolyticum]OLQ69830.1 hypothetical protein BIT28_07555 [Photobacterium proteolyticum]
MRKMTLTEVELYLQEHPNRSFVLDPCGKSNRATIFEKQGGFVPEIIIETVLWPKDWLAQVRPMTVTEDS